MPQFILGKRAVYSLTGSDAVRYLNGQVTQDVRKLLAEPSKALATCVTDARGRLQALATLYLRDTEKPEIFIETESSLREPIYERLSRYLIADDAELTDVSDDWILVHHLGHHPNENSYAFERLGVPGFDQWVPAHTELDAADAWDTLQAERVRIQHGMPSWDHDVSAGMLPQEAGLEPMTLSFQKGCYIGQEVISRIKSAGKVNRMLQKFLLHDAQSIVGGELLAEDGNHVVGTLTSVAFPHALGYLHKKGFGQQYFNLRLPDGRVLLHAVTTATA